MLHDIKGIGEFSKKGSRRWQIRAQALDKFAAVGPGQAVRLGIIEAVTDLALLVLPYVLQDSISKSLRGFFARSGAQQIHRRSQGLHERVARAASSDVTSDPLRTRLIDVAVDKVR